MQRKRGFHHEAHLSAKRSLPAAGLGLGCADSFTGLPDNLRPAIPGMPTGKNAPGAKHKSSSIRVLKKFYKNFMKTLAISSKVHYTIYIEIDLVTAGAEQE